MSRNPPWEPFADGLGSAEVMWYVASANGGVTTPEIRDEYDPLDRLAAGPDHTRVEEAELETIDSEAHETFEKTIRRRWYAQIALGMFVALSIEYALWQLFGWYALPLALLALPYFHRKKWERQTDYGALAAAKLVESAPGDQNRTRTR